MPVPNPTRSDRRQVLGEILKQSAATTQQDLVAALTAAGFVATQSSVSRDLKDLGAIKTANGYELPGVPTSAADELAQVAGLLRDLKPAGPNLLVIKTAIGAAQRVALALDRSGWPEIVGNVGGDDTVFTATPDARALRVLIGRINRATARC